MEINKEDDDGYSSLHKHVGGLKGNRDSFFDVLKSLKSESAISERIHVIEGDIVEKLEAFLEKYRWARFCFCLMDLDVYEPTRIVLDKLYKFVVPGGVIVFDEYSFPEWPGETKAVDEFILRYDLKLRSIPWTFAPAAYCIKTHA